MKIYNLIIAVTVIAVTASIVITSCNSDIDVGPQTNDDRGGFFIDQRGGSYDRDDIHISIVANGVAFSEKVGTIEILASFFDSLGNEAYVDSFLINNTLMERDSTNTGVYRRVYGFNGRSKSEGEALFGDTLTVEVNEDNGVPNFEFKFYLPELVNFIVYDHGDHIDTDSSLTVTWYPDYSNNDDVTVGIMGWDEIAATRSYIWDYWDTADDGSFTISKNDLQQFKHSTHVKIGIQRAQRLESVLDSIKDYDAVVTVGIFDGSRGIPIK